MSDEKEMTWALCPKCGELMGWPVGEPVDSCCDVCQSNIEIMSYKSAFIDARVRIDKLEAKLAVYRAALEPYWLPIWERSLFDRKMVPTMMSPFPYGI